MRTRPITVIATALALLAAAPLTARAQDSTPTPTPTASAADAKNDWPKDVQRVYDDYRRDGVVDVCDHTQQTLQDTLDTIEPAYDQDYPDFREAISAGIEKHKSGDCGSDDSSSGQGGAGAGAGATPTPSATPSPDTSSSDDSGTESGTLPPSGDDSSSSSSGSGAVPPEDDIPPQAGITPAPTAAPPAAAPPAAAPPAATPQQQVIVHTAHRSLTLPIALIVIALLGALALALSAIAARRSPKVAHAWREAAFRTRGTWADFSDWLRLGR